MQRYISGVTTIYFLVMLIPSLATSVFANGQPMLPEQTAHAGKLEGVLAPDRYVGVVTFASKTLKAFRIRSGVPTTEPCVMPLTGPTSFSLNGWEPLTVHIDGSFASVLELRGQFPQVGDVDCEVTYSGPDVDAQYDSGLADIIRSCEYEDHARTDYFIVVGDPKKPFQNAAFIGPVRKEDVPDIAWAVDYVYDYMGGKVADTDAPRLLKNSHSWVKAMGQAIIDRQQLMERLKHPAATAATHESK